MILPYVRFRLSPRKSDCIHTSSAGIDPRPVMLAALEVNNRNGMTLAEKAALALCAAFVEVIPNPRITERFQGEWHIC